MTEEEQIELIKSIVSDIKIIAIEICNIRSRNERVPERFLSGYVYPNKACDNELSFIEEAFLEGFELYGSPFTVDHGSGIMQCLVKWKYKDLE